MLRLPPVAEAWIGEAIDQSTFSSLLFLNHISFGWYVVYVNVMYGKLYMSRRIHFPVIVFSAVTRLDLEVNALDVCLEAFLQVMFS